ncbi:MAG: gamma carbonic anhydrase family protein [Desulfobacterales bacterium]|nr:gamma carbonic anhydrase family protein [Desulfobacterales bacterium]
MPLYSHRSHSPRIHDTAFVAPSADIIGHVILGENASVWFQAVIRGDQDRITIGRNSNIQDHTTCHADENVPLTIGDGVIVGHNCVIHGCTIEDGCLIGMGAVVMNHARIGTGSVVAAGSVVLENTIIPPYSLVAGAPAKVKKTYGSAAAILDKIKQGVDVYLGNTRDYKDPGVFRALDP